MSQRTENEPAGAAGAAMAAQDDVENFQTWANNMLVMFDRTLKAMPGYCADAMQPILLRFENTCANMEKFLKDKDKSPKRNK